MSNRPKVTTGLLAAIAVLLAAHLVIQPTAVGQGAQVPVPDVIRAKSFEVVGDDGEVFIRLHRAGPNSEIILYDNQEMRIFLMAGQRGSIMTRDEKGHTLLRTGTTVAGGGTLTLYGTEGKTAVMLGITRDGGGRIDVRNNKAKPTVVLDSDKAGTGRISIVGRDFNVRLLTYSGCRRPAAD